MTTRPTGLLDASTVILLPRLRDPGGLPDAPLISAITLAELSVGPLVATTDTERAARLAHLQQAEADLEPLPFDADAARAFGQGPRDRIGRPATRGSRSGTPVPGLPNWSGRWSDSSRTHRGALPAGGAPR